MMKDSISQKHITILNFYVSNGALNKAKFDRLRRETDDPIVKGKYINTHFSERNTTSR